MHNDMINVFVLVCIW